ncbi:MAG: endonuclease [Gammaproteobacteria bacterium]
MNKIRLFQPVYLLASLFLCTIMVAPAAQTLPVESYDEVVVNTFWNELYSNGGWSLYCGYRFDAANGVTDGRLVVIEQIYPSSWMLESLSCDSRKSCREDEQSRFTRMEADMHNLYPVWQEVNVVRRDSRFGMVDGEDWRYSDCDFEKKFGIIEPRPIARGNIARAVFYMHSQYGVPIDADMLDTLKQWNREDPPSNQEILRNNKIEELQGNRNVYIDNPALAEQLSSKWLAND